MKVTVEFDGTEEKDELRECLDGWKWKMVAWDLDQELRSKLKYSELTEEQYNVYETMRKGLNELISEYNLKLD